MYIWKQADLLKCCSKVFVWEPYAPSNELLQFKIYFNWNGRKRYFLANTVIDMRKQRVFIIYTSQQSTLQPNIRTGKISLEIDMKAISKPKKKIA